MIQNNSMNDFDKDMMEVVEVSKKIAAATAISNSFYPVLFPILKVGQTPIPFPDPSSPSTSQDLTKHPQEKIRKK